MRPALRIATIEEPKPLAPRAQPEDGSLESIRFHARYCAGEAIRQGSVGADEVARAERARIWGRRAAKYAAEALKDSVR